MPRGHFPRARNVQRLGLSQAQRKERAG
jgi:hypothetical protein